MSHALETFVCTAYVNQHGVIQLGPAPEEQKKFPNGKAEFTFNLNDPSFLSHRVEIRLLVRDGEAPVLMFYRPLDENMEPLSDWITPNGISRSAVERAAT